jgi:hypothetical protein
LKKRFEESFPRLRFLSWYRSTHLIFTYRLTNSSARSDDR